MFLCFSSCNVSPNVQDMPVQGSEDQDLPQDADSRKLWANARYEDLKAQMPDTFIPQPSSASPDETFRHTTLISYHHTVIDEFQKKTQSKDIDLPQPPSNIEIEFLLVCKRGIAYSVISFVSADSEYGRGKP